VSTPCLARPEQIHTEQRAKHERHAHTSSSLAPALELLPPMIRGSAGNTGGEARRGEKRRCRAAAKAAN
jgi:hypothetical protein